MKLKNIVRRLVLFMSMMSVCATLFAQLDPHKLYSVGIVALDRRAPMVNLYWDPYLVSNAIKTLNNRFMASPDTYYGVVYGIKENARTPENFALVIKKHVDPSRLTSLLGDLDRNRGNEIYYSITSFAKPYSLIALKGMEETNRTYLYLITDGKYNGNDDYYNEAVYAKRDFSQEGHDQFQNDIEKVQTNYFCKFLSQQAITEGYVQLYEFIPLQQYFTMESLIKFPQKIELQRGKDNLVGRIDIEPLKNDNYEVKKLQLIVGLKAKSDTINVPISPKNEEVVFNLPLSTKAEDVEVELKGWVKLKDGIYDNSVLHPDGPVLQGSAGLVRQISVSKEPVSKIWGLVPMPQWLFKISFFTEKQSEAAVWWGWILAFILLAIILAGVAFSNIYKPKSKDMKI